MSPGELQWDNQSRRRSVDGRFPSWLNYRNSFCNRRQQMVTRCHDTLGQYVEDWLQSQHPPPPPTSVPPPSPPPDSHLVPAVREKRWPNSQWRPTAWLCGKTPQRRSRRPHVACEILADSVHRIPHAISWLHVNLVRKKVGSLLWHEAGDLTDSRKCSSFGFLSRGSIGTRWPTHPRCTHPPYPRPPSFTTPLISIHSLSLATRVSQHWLILVVV